MAVVGTGGIGSGCIGGYGGRDKVRDGYGDGFTSPVPLAEGGEVYPYSLLGRPAGRGVHVTGGGPDPQGRRVLPRHWTGGGGVGSVDGHYKFSLRQLHLLP